MNSFRRFRFAALAFALVLLVMPAVRFHGQMPTGAGQPGKAITSGPDKMDAPESNSQEEQFRTSAAVKSIAHAFHIKTETAAEIFEDFNSGVLIVAILAFLARALPKAFRRRRERLEKDLTAAREATADADSRLRVVEDRLGHLDGEIEAVRKQMEQDSAGDEQRIKETIEAERKRIVASAEQEIAAAQAAAQRELKRFAAELAVDRAAKEIRLTPEADRDLVSGFAREIAVRFGRGVQN